MKKTVASTMVTSKKRGTGKVKQVVKPMPEPVQYFTIDFFSFMDYIGTLAPDISNKLVDYWVAMEVFEGQPERVYLPLPDKDDPLYLLTKIILSEYPDFYHTEFEMSY
jgi:hypothetical protein